MNSPTPNAYCRRTGCFQLEMVALSPHGPPTEWVVNCRRVDGETRINNLIEHYSLVEMGADLES